MPHGLFLGSALATQDRVSEGPFTMTVMLKENPSDESIPLPQRNTTGGAFMNKLKKLFKPTKSDIDDIIPDGRDGYANWENRSNSFVRAHLRHGVVDVVVSLLGFAVIINSLCVTSLCLTHGVTNKSIK